MKLLHCADLHLGLASYGRDVEEFGRTLELFVDIAIEHSVDVAIIAGDLFHSRRPGPKEMAIAARCLRRLSDLKIDTVVGTGNHDGMTTIADPETHTLRWIDEVRLPYVYVATRPEVMHLQSGDIAVLPYAHRRSWESGDMSLPERTAYASKVLAEAIEQLAGQRRPGHPLVFVGHLTTTHAKLGAEAAMMMGWDTTVDPSVFDSFDYAALGHIHVGQQVSLKAWYAGSPDVHGFGERADDKRFLLVDAAEGVPPHVTPIRTDPRPLIVLEAKESEEWSTPTGWPDGSIVQLELYPERRLDALAMRTVVARLREQGASFVQTKVMEPDLPRALPRSRDGHGPETLDEQIDVWLDRQRTPTGDPLAKAQRERVKALALRTATDE